MKQLITENFIHLNVKGANEFKERTSSIECVVEEHICTIERFIQMSRVSRSFY